MPNFGPTCTYEMSRDLATGGRIFAKFVSKDARYFTGKSHRKLSRDQRRSRGKLVMLVKLGADVHRVTDLLEMGVFLGWIGVIEPHDQLALEGQLVVLVEQGSLGMANV